MRRSAPVVSELFLQHRIGVLTEQRRTAELGLVPTLEAQRHGQRREGTQHRMREFPHHAARADMRIGEDLVQRQHRAVRYVHGIERGDRLGARQKSHGIVQRRHHRVALREAARIGGERRVRAHRGEP